MKKNHTLLGLLVVLAVLFVSAQLYAVQGPQDVSDTAHNLGFGPGARQWKSADVASGGTEEVCVFCHTPHNSSAALPLWNRYSGIGNKAFLMYTASASLTATVKANATLSSDSASRLCLTCHDGTTALNALVRSGLPGNAAPELSTLDTSFDASGVYAVGEGPNLGTNLTNMHPINFDYDAAQAEEGAAGLHPIASVKLDLKFFGPGATLLECATCHDPHVDYGVTSPGGDVTDGDTRYRPFLRKPNTSSGLCLTCHNK